MATTTTLITGSNFLGTFEAGSNNTWADLGDSLYGTWDSWTEWNDNPANLVIESFVDAEESDTRQPNWFANIRGELTIELEVGDEVDSNNNIVGGTTYNFNDTTERTIAAARYYKFTATITTDSNLTVPFSNVPSVSFSQRRITQSFKDLDTATLAGTADARQLDTDVVVVRDILVTATQSRSDTSPGTFADRQYAVPDDYQFEESAVLVNIVSKSPPTIRCFDMNNESIDAVIDIAVSGLTTVVLTETGIEST